MVVYNYRRMHSWNRAFADIVGVLSGKENSMDGKPVMASTVQWLATKIASTLIQTLSLMHF